MTETESNYFTEVEEHFRRIRGTPLFRLTSNDWVLIERWKKGGVPLEAILRGIDAAFGTWRKNPARARHEMVNSLAYCVQAVTVAAQAMANRTPAPSPDREAPFGLDAIRGYVVGNAAKLRKAGHEDLAISLEAMDLKVLYSDLEQMEQRLATIEETMIARLRAAASNEALFEVRRSFDAELKAYRGKMSTDQLAMLEKQFLTRKLLQASGLPRLSLFYLSV